MICIINSYFKFSLPEFAVLKACYMMDMLILPTLYGYVNNTNKK